jgi:hypothetical protein
MLFATNLDPFFDSIQAWVVTQRLVATHVARGLSVEAFNHLPTVSAQYSGDFAANWRYKVGAVDTSFTPDALPKSTLRRHYSNRKKDGAHITSFYSDRKMGSQEAIVYAYGHNAGKEGAVVALGPSIYISNSAKHDEFYAWKIENNEIKFRDGNEGSPVAKTYGLMAARFGGVLTPEKIALLISVKIGRLG